MQPKLFFALTAIMAAMAFASCSGDDSTSPTAASSGAAASGVTSAASKAAAPTTGGGSSGGGAAQVPADGCALLSLDEAKKLSPAMAAGKPGGPSSGPIKGVSCSWEWQDTTKAISFGTLTVQVQTLQPESPLRP